MCQYVFGPVPSRRLGRSLGVDLVPLKTCSYDCVYCQLGRTTCRTVERKQWVPLEEVVRQVRNSLDRRPDYITLSGSGEPTLFQPLDRLINQIKTFTDIPLAVLTNGSLLWQEDLQQELSRADLVVPSLDAGDEATFQKINRPHPALSFARMLQGLVQFRERFQGEIWLEVFLLEENTQPEERLERLVECVKQVKPDKVQLNTVTRPPAERWVRGLSKERLKALAERFFPQAEVIAEFRGVHEQAAFQAGREEVLALLQRRPCTVEEIAAGLSMHLNEVLKYLQELTELGQVNVSSVGQTLYYQAVERQPHTAD